MLSIYSTLLLFRTNLLFNKHSITYALETISGDTPENKIENYPIYIKLGLVVIFYYLHAYLVNS